MCFHGVSIPRCSMYGIFPYNTGSLMGQNVGQSSSTMLRIWVWKLSGASIFHGFFQSFSTFSHRSSRSILVAAESLLDPVDVRRLEQRRGAGPRALSRGRPLRGQRPGPARQRHPVVSAGAGGGAQQHGDGEGLAGDAWKTREWEISGEFHGFNQILRMISG